MKRARVPLLHRIAFVYCVIAAFALSVGALMLPIALMVYVVSVFR